MTVDKLENMDQIEYMASLDLSLTDVPMIYSLGKV